MKLCADALQAVLCSRCDQAVQHAADALREMPWAAEVPKATLQLRLHAAEPLFLASPSPANLSRLSQLLMASNISSANFRGFFIASCA